MFFSLLFKCYKKLDIKIMSAGHSSSAYIDLTAKPVEQPELSQSIEPVEPAEPKFLPSGYYGEGYLRMLKRVVQKCELEKSNAYKVIHTSAYIDRAAFLTGLQKDVLKRLLDDEIMPIDEYVVDRSVIHNELVKFYLLDGLIPTTTQLFNSLSGKFPPHIDIRTFRKILIKLGYIWRKVAENSLVVTERPNIIFERVNYLKKIIHYRQQTQSIYFVDENYFDTDYNYYNLQEDFQCQQQNLTGQHGIIYAVNRSGIHAKKYVEKFYARQFQVWVSDELLPILRPKSVVVFKKHEHHIQQIIIPPTFESVKIEMMEWLEYHNVSHNKEMSKTELWSLIENYTNLDENMYIIDNILKSHGHTALHLPSCINELTPTSLVYELIKQNLKLVSKNADVQGKLDLIIDSIKTELETYDDFIKSEEILIFNEELKVDSVFDKLIKKMSNANIKDDYDSDLPSSDSD